MVTLPPDRPAVMGILNVTPDSFSDGGLFVDAAAAVDHGLRMTDKGADLVDVGGESTRPGAEAVSAEEESRRVVPVVEALAKRGVVVSVDTSKALVARRALEAGARVLNDVTALSDPEMANVCASSDCTICLMHMQGEPRTMQANPEYDDVVSEVRDYLVSRATWCETQGLKRERLWIDPGIGFGKTLGHNLQLLRHLGSFVATGYPVLLGVSRKSFIGKLCDGAATGERLPGTLAVQALAQLNGVKIIRAHDVKETVQAVTVLRAVQSTAS